MESFEQSSEKDTGRNVDQKKNKDHPDHSIAKIGLDTQKTLRNL